MGFPSRICPHLYNFDVNGEQAAHINGRSRAPTMEQQDKPCGTRLSLVVFRRVYSLKGIEQVMNILNK